MSVVFDNPIENGFISKVNLALRAFSKNSTKQGKPLYAIWRGIQLGPLVFLQNPELSLNRSDSSA